MLISDISCTRASSLVIVHKKEGEIRMAVDYREVNQYLRVSANQLPYQDMLFFHKVLEGFYLNEAVVYIDDTVVYGKDAASFLQMLDMVLDRMAKFNVRLKPAKCSFGMISVEF